MKRPPRPSSSTSRTSRRKRLHEDTQILNTIKMPRTSSSSSSEIKQENHITEPDRISNLPEPILHHILSFLPTKDATKTCVLSKTWNSAWNSFPILKFNHREFRDALDSLRSRNGSSKKRYGFKQAAKDFCNYVRNSITRRERETDDSGCIRKFKLRIYFQGRGLKDHSPDIDSWLDYAVNKNVQSLALHNYSTTCPRIQERRYVLPQSVFRAKSLEELNLCSCRLPDVYSITDNGIGVSLKKLKISCAYAPEKTLQGLVSKCRVLEEITIESCKGFEFLKIENSPGLKRVDLYLDRKESQVISIEAPNVELLSYAGSLENVLRSVKDSNCKKNVKELRLHDVGLSDELLRMIKEFPMLEKLEMIRCCCNLLNEFQISSDRLVELCISDCFCLKDEKIWLQTRSLKWFRFGDRLLPLGLWNVPDKFGIRLDR